MKIGYDYNSESRYISLLNRQNRFLLKARTFCSQYVKIEDSDMEEFAKDFLEHIYKRKTQGTDLALLKRENVLPMLAIDLKQINLLQQNFNALDKVSPIAPDFEVHIESTKQIALFKKLEKLCKAINELEYPMGQSERIKQAHNNSIELSEEAKFIPSWRYIASVKNMIF
jgi:hypothetical protein